MDSVTVHDLSNVAHICDESQILHAAACILRRQISDITISDDKYLAHEEVQYQILVLSFLPLS
jgi:ABC-type transporter Mla maintaining outer membrane lipid asymmetry ATPase subunit MlaF